MEPIAGYAVKNRAEARPWLLLRHTGSNLGKGVVDWSALAAQQFKGSTPSLQALEFVKTHGNLTAEEIALLETTPLSTLDRLLSTPAVRARIGVDVRHGKLTTTRPADEILKPLRRIIIDLASGAVKVRALNTKADQLKYIDGFDSASRADGGTHTKIPRDVANLQRGDFVGSTVTKPAKTARAKAIGERKTLIPRGAALQILDSKISSIAEELRVLKVGTHSNAISVLFRVFLELSIDYYLDKHKLATTFEDKKNNRKIDLKLNQKLKSVIDDLVNKCHKKKDFDSLDRALHDKNSPLSIELLHNYVHNRFVTPKDRELTSAWDDARQLFRAIWS